MEMEKEMVSCIIPFYNEGERVLQVLDVVASIEGIGEIICVDDGSTDRTFELIKKNCSGINGIKLVRLPSNCGKSAAVRHALKFTRHDTVLLMDADLKNINSDEVHKAVKAMSDRTIDMIILRRVNAAWFVKMNRGDLLFSGERLLRKKDLAAILDEGVNGYELEVAINSYMQDNKRNVLWMSWSAVNTYKSRKRGFFEGLVKDVKMYARMVGYAGAMGLLRQMVGFGSKQLQVE
jgi:glycosyltransferase involved in cell wall biosynthesis